MVLLVVIVCRMGVCWVVSLDGVLYGSVSTLRKDIRNARGFMLKLWCEDSNQPTPHEEDSRGLAAQRRRRRMTHEPPHEFSI